MSKVMIDNCDVHSESVEAFYECFKKVSVNGDSLILQTRKFHFNDYRFENTTAYIWKSVTSYFFGQCVTTKKIGSLDDGELLKIYLNKSMEYKIWIHDADFFFLSLNPNSIPKLELDFSPSIQSGTETKIGYKTVLQYLDNQKNIHMNRKKDCKT